MRFFLSLSLIVIFCSSVFSQTINDQIEGKPYLKVFSNFHADLSENNQEYGFELTRAYFGYKAKLGDNFETNVCIDAGTFKNDDGTKLYKIYFKYATLFYRKDKFSAAFGLIGLNHFRVQEKMWGHRYLYKSFLDQYKQSHSADLGLTLQYDINEELSVDATLRNGEGYKNLQTDNTLRLGGGLTYNAKYGLVARLYADYYEKQVQQTMFTGFLGYEKKGMFKVGVEYNYIKNADWISSHIKDGVSVFASYDVTDKVELFGRYDDLNSSCHSDVEDICGLDFNGKYIIGGIQYRAGKNVKIALNHQGKLSEPDGTYRNMVYMNFEYRFN